MNNAKIQKTLLIEVVKSFENFDFDFRIDIQFLLGIFQLLEGNFDKIDIVLTKLFAEDKTEGEVIKQLIINFSELPII